jgi:glycosyltransferase involved in cell wall biosynthesis
MWRPGSLSMVIPVYNEESNIRPLIAALLPVVRSLGIPSELILVDDGSSDDTCQALRELQPITPELIVVELARNCGQTAALQAGFDRARGDAIVTMDGDLQNDPADIPRLLQALSEGADVVSGWRRDRKDTLVSRRLPSLLANRLIRMATGVPVHDQGCSLKGYRRDIVRRMDLYGDMHRFIGVLAMPLAVSITELEVRHHPRVAGASKYGLSRVTKVIVDLFTILIVTHFRERPLRLFSLLGFPFLAAALTAGMMSAIGVSQVVLPAVAVITGSTFLTCILAGLLGVLIVDILGNEGRDQVGCREWMTRG